MLRYLFIIPLHLFSKNFFIEIQKNIADSIDLVGIRYIDKDYSNNFLGVDTNFNYSKYCYCSFLLKLHYKLDFLLFFNIQVPLYDQIYLRFGVKYGYLSSFSLFIKPVYMVSKHVKVMMGGDFKDSFKFYEKINFVNSNGSINNKNGNDLNSKKLKEQNVSNIENKQEININLEQPNMIYESIPLAASMSNVQYSRNTIKIDANKFFKNNNIQLLDSNLKIAQFDNRNEVNKSIISSVEISNIEDQEALDVSLHLQKEKDNEWILFNEKSVILNANINKLMLLNILYVLSIKYDQNLQKRNFHNDFNMIIHTQMCKISAANNRRIGFENNKDKIDSYTKLLILKSFLEKNPEIKSCLYKGKKQLQELKLLSGDILGIYGQYLYQALNYGYIDPLNSFYLAVINMWENDGRRFSKCTLINQMSKNIPGYSCSEILLDLLDMSDTNPIIRNPSNQYHIANIFNIYASFIHSQLTNGNLNDDLVDISKINILKKIKNKYPDHAIYVDKFFQLTNVNVVESFSDRQKRHAADSNAYYLNCKEVFELVNELRLLDKQKWLEFFADYYMKLISKKNYLLESDVRYANIINLLENSDAQYNGELNASYAVSNSCYFDLSNEILKVLKFYSISIANDLNEIITSPKSKLKEYQKEFYDYIKEKHLLKNEDKRIFIRSEQKLFYWNGNEAVKITFEKDSLIFIESSYILLDLFISPFIIYDISKNKAYETVSYKELCKVSSDCTIFLANESSNNKELKRFKIDINEQGVVLSKVHGLISSNNYFTKSIKLKSFDGAKINALLAKYREAYNKLRKTEKKLKKLYNNANLSFKKNYDIKILQGYLLKYLSDKEKMCRYISQKMKFSDDISKFYKQLIQYNDLKGMYNNMSVSSKEAKEYIISQANFSKINAEYDDLNNKFKDYDLDTDKILSFYFVVKNYNDLIFDSLDFMKGLVYQREDDYGKIKKNILKEKIKDPFIIRLVEKFEFSYIFYEFIEECLPIIRELYNKQNDLVVVKNLLQDLYNLCDKGSKKNKLWKKYSEFMKGNINSYKEHIFNLPKNMEVATISKINKSKKVSFIEKLKRIFVKNAKSANPTSNALKRINNPKLYIDIKDIIDFHDPRLLNCFLTKDDIVEFRERDKKFDYDLN